MEIERMAHGTCPAKCWQEVSAVGGGSGGEWGQSEAAAPRTNGSWTRTSATSTLAGIFSWNLVRAPRQQL